MPAPVDREDRDPQEAEESVQLLPPGQASEATPDLAEMGLSAQKFNPEWRKGDDIARYTALSASFFTLVVTLVGLLTQSAEYTWFSWHPILHTLAFPVFVYGVLTLQPTSQPKSKEAGLVRHQAALFGVAVPAAILGTVAVFYNKYLHDKHHFKSLHGQLGLLCTLWLVVQVLVGGASVWGGGVAFGGGMKAKKVWRYHRISGYVLFLCLLCTINLGGESGWAKRNVGAFFKFVAYTIAPVVVLGASAVRVRWSKMKIF
ncbi:hypothetical protein CYLTODRAFT_424556 [Cylindrobasidium torrendii FP15055 ss-10]|uniref:Cytochrome b561 domain-containing protein n=1 Tax=Cylindrobasidium torrendii FP15055 ss-10 TaxID=1314674 RepID=A0A0D7B4T4_9AGAR|nr:hypothetical protein CYLTODRAFT_424556 [Cylindrobasidium torrendii FP15055 ss-10]